MYELIITIIYGLSVTRAWISQRSTKPFGLSAWVGGCVHKGHTDNQATEEENK